MRVPDPRTLVLRAAAAGVILWSATPPQTARAQQQPDVQTMAERVDRMERQLETTQRELEEYRAALTGLRQQVQEMAKACGQPCTPGSAAAAAPLEQAVNELREEQSVQQSEIAVHEQAKVETQSRYNLRIGGLVLFNAFQNDGGVDSLDVPVLAIPRPAGGSHVTTGASVRQSLLTLDATGPRFGGAHTYANLQLDFFGGLSTSDYTTTAGTVRMREASILTEWPGWRIHAGLERLLISQLSPTSYATIGEPAMAWSGNLWAWVPQVTAEKTWDLNDSNRFSLAAAVADIPDPGPASNQYLRNASAAEQSRFPGAEMRTGYAWGSSHSSSLGVSGYLSPHNYGKSGSIDAWAGLLDWNIALPGRLSLSGEAYKGQALGGLGGGAFKDVGYTYIYAYHEAAPSNYKAVGLRDSGGWAQLKLRPLAALEFNGAFGLDDDPAAQLRATGISPSNPYSGLARNQTTLGNVIFRPRASFLLSLEYRKLRSWQFTSSASEAQIFGLAAGYEF